MIASLALRYLAVFAVILAAMSVGAYEFLAREYTALLQPVLGTPDGSRAYNVAMARVLETIIAFDVPLLLLVGFASWLLARSSLAALLAARDRERAFAADAAHALRSPLATIAAIAQSMRSELPQAQQQLTTLTRAAIDASAVVRDLLTLARSSEPHALLREPVDLGAVAADTAKEFEAAAGAKGVIVRSETRTGIVDGDEARLRELTRNLLDNAIRHAHSCVTIGLRSNHQTLEFVVGNDGDRVADDERERIFDRFYTGERESSGSGLGLAIVRWIAQAHGGGVSLRDSAENGTEFVVRLPVLRD